MVLNILTQYPVLCFQAAVAKMAEFELKKHAVTTAQTAYDSKCHADRPEPYVPCCGNPDCDTLLSTLHTAVQEKVAAEAEQITAQAELAMALSECYVKRAWRSVYQSLT